jgi:hypothetical protein
MLILILHKPYPSTIKLPYHRRILFLLSESCQELHPAFQVATEANECSQEAAKHGFPT